MFLHCLKLRNLLSFREPEPLKLEPLNLFIGPNGSGKSNLLDSIELLQALPNSPVNYINRRGGTDAWVWKGAKRTENAARVACDFELENDRLRYEIAFSSVDRVLVIQTEMLAKAEDPNHQPPYLKRFAGNVQIGTMDGNPSITSTESVFAAYRNPLDPTPITRSARAFDAIRVYREFKTGTDDDLRRGVSSSAEKHPLDPTGSNLALVLQEMDFQGALQNVKQYLQRLSDRFEDIKIRAEGGRSQIYLQERGVGMVPAIRLSDGTLKFLCLMAALFDPNPAGVVCIEEPESGLHPDAVATIADALREASTRTQLLVTTHSDALVDRFTGEPEHVVVCERDADESTRFSRLAREPLRDWLEEYTLGDLWKRGEIGGTQR
jgi:predicted ATPase